jgi:hypothetical protein
MINYKDTPYYRIFSQICQYACEGGCEGGFGANVSNSDLVSVTHYIIMSYGNDIFFAILG